jgi:hypothetical protein
MATNTQGGFTVGRAITVGIVTVIAFIIGAGLVLSKPRQFKANATVPMVATSVAFAAPINVQQQADNYAAELTTDAVIDKVSKQLGRSPSDLRSSISNEKIGSSNLVIVSCKGHTTRAAEDCVKAVSGAAYEGTLLENSVTEAKVKEVTQQQLADATAQVNKLVQDNNGIPTDTEYNTVSQQLANDTGQLAAARVATDPGAKARAAALQREVNSLQARLKVLAPKVQQLIEARAQVQYATQNLGNLTTQQAILTALEKGNEELINTSSANKVAKLNSAARTGVATGVVALVLIVGLFILIDVTSKPVSRGGSGNRFGEPESRDPRGGGADGVRTDAERDLESSAS